MDRSGVNWKTIFGIFGLLAMFYLLDMCDNDKKQESRDMVRSVVSDTVCITVHDTVFMEKPMYVEKRVVDTVYMKVDDKTLSLPIEQLHYSKEGVYDLWMSGIKASIDSVRFYVPTTEKVVTRTVTVERVGKTSFACVPYMGFKAFNGSVSPNIGLMLETPKSWVLGAEIGYSKPLNTYWGVNVGYKFGR